MENEIVGGFLVAVVIIVVFGVGVLAGAMSQYQTGWKDGYMAGQNVDLNKIFNDAIKRD